MDLNDALNDFENVLREDASARHNAGKTRSILDLQHSDRARNKPFEYYETKQDIADQIGDRNYAGYNHAILNSAHKLDRKGHYVGKDGATYSSRMTKEEVNRMNKDANAKSAPINDVINGKGATPEYKKDLLKRTKAITRRRKAKAVQNAIKGVGTSIRKTASSVGDRVAGAMTPKRKLALTDAVCELGGNLKDICALYECGRCEENDILLASILAESAELIKQMTSDEE